MIDDSILHGKHSRRGGIDANSDLLERSKSIVSARSVANKANRSHSSGEETPDMGRSPEATPSSTPMIVQQPGSNASKINKAKVGFASGRLGKTYNAEDRGSGLLNFT